MFHNYTPAQLVFQIHHFHNILIFQCLFDFLDLLIWQLLNQSRTKVFSFHMEIVQCEFFHEF